MSAPDRIWATVEGTDSFGIFGKHYDGYAGMHYAKPFLASTPAREHAEELAEALRHMVYLQTGGPSTGIDAMKKLGAAMHLLSRLDQQNTGETDAD